MNLIYDNPNTDLNQTVTIEFTVTMGEILEAVNNAQWMLYTSIDETLTGKHDPLKPGTLSDLGYIVAVALGVEYWNGGFITNDGEREDE